MIFPYIVMHLEMQSRKYHLLDLENLIISVYNIISYIQNHGSTFIFDRGKKNRIYLLLQISWQSYIQILNLQNQRPLHILTISLPVHNIFNYDKLVTISKPLASQILLHTTDKVIPRNTLYQLTPSSKKGNNATRKNLIFNHTWKGFPNYTDTIVKYVHTEIFQNFVALAKRAEMIIERNRLLITELTRSDPEFTSRELKAWRQKMAYHKIHLERQLNQPLQFFSNRRRTANRRVSLTRQSEL